MESAAVLSSAHEDTKGLVRKVTLLDCELAEQRRTRQVVKEKFRSFSDAAADGAWWLVVSERDCWEQFEEFSLLRAWGSKLCLAIVGLPGVRNHLAEGMRTAALHHTEMA
jgi:hypothetical protein